MCTKADFTRQDVFATDRGMDCPNCGMPEGNCIWVFSYFAGDSTIQGQCASCHRAEEFPAVHAMTADRNVTIQHIKMDHLRARTIDDVNARTRVVYPGSRLPVIP